MSVLIRGGAMPSECSNCYICGRGYCLELFEYCPEEGRLPDCPLVEVPTPHGRLIDADKMEDEYKKKYGVSICFGGVPTVIEAEEG